MDVAPLVITGMHRSGTSATARLLQHAGLDVGSDLLTPAIDNPLGYFEDLDFCQLNLDLVAAGVGDDPQHRPDWAFADRIVPSLLTPLRPRAEALLATRARRGHAWGFKDPRTSVLLDFYDGLVPDARYLFVYRAPWEVLTSLVSTQQRPLYGRADLAVHAWTSYNRRLLEFRERHPERTVLVHLDAVAQQPVEVLGLVRAQAQWPSSVLLDAVAARDAFVGRLLRRVDASSALAELLAAHHPEAMDVYARLEAGADLPAQQRVASGPAAAVDIEALRGMPADDAGRDHADVRRQVFDAVTAEHERADRAEGCARDADARARGAQAVSTAAEERANAADAERARVVALLEQIQSSRTWRAAVLWWRFRGRFRFSRRAD